MSIKQMSLVWEHEFDHAEQSVMMALADHAHDDGTEIRPGIARLAWKTGYSEQQVRRVLKRLRDDKGILVMTREGGGRGRPNVYRIDWGKAAKKSPFTPPNRKPQNPDISAQKGDISDENPDTAVSPEPSVEPSKEPSVSPTGAQPLPEETEKPAYAITRLTVERTREVGFDAAPHQRANWGRGWAEFCYVSGDAEGEPPSAERQHAVLSEIVAAAAGKGGKARYFLAVGDAVKRVDGGPGDGRTRSRRGGRPAGHEGDTSRSRGNTYSLREYLEEKSGKRRAS